MRLIQNLFYDRVRCLPLDISNNHIGTVIMTSETSAKTKCSKNWVPPDARSCRLCGSFHRRHRYARSTI